MKTASYIYKLKEKTCKYDKSLTVIYSITLAFFFIIVETCIYSSGCDVCNTLKTWERRKTLKWKCNVIKYSNLVLYFQMYLGKL